MTSLQRALSGEIASSVEIAISEVGALPDLLRLVEHSREELVLQAPLYPSLPTPNPTPHPSPHPGLALALA